MSLYKRFKYLKTALQILLTLNVFVVLWGLIAFFKYYGSHDPSSLEMVIVGLLTLVIGVMAPLTISYYLVRVSKKLTRQAHERVAQMIGLWAKDSGLMQQEGIKNPFVWLNLGIAIAEIFTADSEHPAATLVQEMGPLLRKEIRAHLYKES